MLGFGVRRFYYCVFMCVYLSCCVRLRYVRLMHLSHTHTDIIVVLLINSSMYICVSVAFVLFILMFKYIMAFRNNKKSASAIKFPNQCSSKKFNSFY